MTGLDLRNDALIEIAVLVTDGELAVLGEGVDIVIHADDAALANMPDVVRDMHAHSGLTDEVRQSVVTIVDDLPASERFFAGGDTTVRGFALDRLGDKRTISASGFPTGGNAEVKEGIARAWQDRDNWSEERKNVSQPFADPRVWEFIRKAGACRTASAPGSAG